MDIGRESVIGGDGIALMQIMGENICLDWLLAQVNNGYRFSLFYKNPHHSPPVTYYEGPAQAMEMCVRGCSFSPVDNPSTRSILLYFS